MTDQREQLAKAIIRAAKRGEGDAVRALLDQDASLIDARDRDESTPLHCACWKGHQDVVALLIERGADVKARNHNTHWGDTPLHAAAHGNRRACAKALIAAGADLQARNLNGNTPLQETAFHKATPVANLLKRHGVSE